MAYHRVLAGLAPLLYGRPSEKMIVVGVTGTAGKSSTIEFISHVLESGGFHVGSASTIKFKIKETEIVNDKKMTMVGRFQLQRMMRRMVRAGCTHAIIETTSEGIVQYRHIGVHYDVVVFTNLYPEHIDSHGSFENYKNAKLKLFQKLERDPYKTIHGKRIPKAIIANIDNEHAGDFLDFKVDTKIGFCMKNKDERLKIKGTSQVVVAENIESSFHGISFVIHNSKFVINILGEHNVYNALAGYAVGHLFDVSNDNMRRGIESVTSIPGRLELIDAGQPYTVIVDFAFEPQAMRKLYDAVTKISHARVIHVLGTTGGGRDASRGAKLGEMAAQFADIVIATNEDPYDDDPEVLIDRVVSGAKNGGMVLGDTLLKVSDRKEAITKALSEAHDQDVVLITGKGSETTMAVAGGKLIPWNDRAAVLEILHCE